MEYPAGWTCERTIREFESYLLSALELLDSLAMAEHIEACEGCSQTLVIYRVRLVEGRRG